MFASKIFGFARTPFEKSNSALHSWKPKSVSIIKDGAYKEDEDNKDYAISYLKALAADESSVARTMVSTVSTLASDEKIMEELTNNPHTQAMINQMQELFESGEANIFKETESKKLMAIAHETTNQLFCDMCKKPLGIAEVVYAKEGNPGIVPPTEEEKWMRRAKRNVVMLTIVTVVAGFVAQYCKSLAAQFLKSAFSSFRLQFAAPRA